MPSDEPNSPSKNSLPSKLTHSAPQLRPSTPIAPRNRKSSANVRWNITNSMAAKMGMPAHLLVSTLSIFSDLLMRALSVFLDSAGEKFLVM